MTIAFALASSALFHVALYALLPDNFMSSAKTDKDMRHTLEIQADAQEEEFLPEELAPDFLPQKPKFVEINPEAPNILPPDTLDTGAATQRAAQPDPDRNADTRQTAPKIEDGNSPDSPRIQNNIPRELRPTHEQPLPGIPLGQPSGETSLEHMSPPSQSESSPAPRQTHDGKNVVHNNTAQTAQQTPTPTDPVPPKEAGTDPSDLESKPTPPATPSQTRLPPQSPATETATTAPGAKTANSASQQDAARAENAPPATMARLGEAPLPPSPLPRPQAAKVGTTGEILKTKYATNEAGTLALDSRFSEFGDYTQRFLEIIQARWWTNCERTRLHAPESIVVIEFILCKDGTLKEVTITHHNSSEPGAYACKDAIESCAPFDPWPPEMVKVLGLEESTRIIFQYK